MGMAQVMYSPETSVADDRYQSRLDSAEEVDLAYFIRSIAKTRLADEDVYLLAGILRAAMKGSGPLNKAIVEDEIVARGRSRHKAHILASAIFK